MGTLFSRSSESAQDTLSSLNHENTNQYDFSSPLTLQPHHIVEEYSPRFDLEDPLWLEYLQDNGYVIIKDIAMRNEIVEALKLLWEFLEEKCQMYEGNPETWTDENFAKLGDSRTGILSFSGIQHSKFLWYLRLLPKVRQIFEQIYKTDDLLTSFDGGNIFRPWHNLKLAEKEHLKTSTGWFHVDQGKTLIGFHCIQGLVSLTDCNQYTGGFCVIPGSHLHHEKFVFDAAKKSNQNFVMIPHDSPYLISPYRQVE